MKTFLQKHAASVTGILSGFDRLVFRGSLREISYVNGMRRYLSQAGVLLKAFGAHAEAVTERIKAASVKVALLSTAFVTAICVATCSPLRHPTPKQRAGTPAR